MDYINFRKWKIKVNLFSGYNINGYSEIIENKMKINNNVHYSEKKPHFKHSSRRLNDLPLLLDNINGTKYLSAAFVYDEYGHLSFNRIEIRNNKSFIFIADKNYFKNKVGNVKVKIFNTDKIKYILAASFHMENKRNFILNYDSDNVIFNNIIPYNSYFEIDADILRETSVFKEKISFGSEIIENKMIYNALKIKRIKFNNRECFGIIQGGNDHLFLYNLGKKINENLTKI